MGEVALFLVVVIVAGGLIFWAYRSAMQRMEERVMEKLAETQREQQRQQRAALGLTPPPPQNHQYAALQEEIDGIPQDIFERECADVLAQIADRRRQFRRPPTRRRFTAE